MNWFQRHLNWTWVLSLLLVLVLAFIAGIVVQLTGPNVGGDYGAIAQQLRVELASKVADLVGSIIILISSVWVINRKGRSLWWLLLSGAFSPLWLKNNRKKPGSVSASPSLKVATIYCTCGETLQVSGASVICPKCQTEWLSEQIDLDG